MVPVFISFYFLRADISNASNPEPAPTDTPSRMLSNATPKAVPTPLPVVSQKEKLALCINQFLLYCPQ
jgi:hypothetical protein